MTTTPRQAVITMQGALSLPLGTDERFTGYGAMGVPYSRGHYLALRDMLASSVGPAYRAIWHRDPTGSWTIFTTADPDVSCPRYFGSATAVEQVPAIDVTWRDDWSLDVSMGARLSWRMVLEATSATRAMTSMGGAMPAWAWSSNALLAAMGPMASTVLQSGRIRLHGRTPNGQAFKAAPLQVWQVVSGEARVDGIGCGPMGSLATQARLADFWLPQRGLFFVGQARFSGTEQVSVAPRLAEERRE
ncbi:MAG: hypothetical protein ABIS84_11710 [Arachnia sp.]